tara:strand:- start:13005 stop:13931 length:927 start_codon:yes stop_codon:yes gene_type:complete
MSILLVAQRRDMKPFRDAILNADSNIDVEIWPNTTNPARVQFAVAWHHPQQIWKSYPNLKVISSLGAGVDHLLRDNTIPDNVQLTRVVVPSLSDQMSDYVLTAVLNIIRNSELYRNQQLESVWKSHPAYLKDELTVGVMGLGELGSTTAERLYLNGFKVNGLAQSKKELKGITTYTAGTLGEFLNQTHILVNLLPLTPKTDGILDLDLFKELKKPAFLINVARGEHLIEEDLVYALDKGIITHAVLDVFSTEPLPDSHPFWGRKKITITPHIASVTDPDEVAVLLIENYKRILSGMDLLNTVDKKRGY